MMMVFFLFSAQIFVFGKTKLGFVLDDWGLFWVWRHMGMLGDYWVISIW